MEKNIFTRISGNCMKGKITWLNWSLKKNQKKWGKVHSDSRKSGINRFHFPSVCSGMEGDPGIQEKEVSGPQAGKQRTLRRLVGFRDDPPPWHPNIFHKVTQHMMLGWSRFSLFMEITSTAHLRAQVATECHCGDRNGNRSRNAGLCWEKKLEKKSQNMEGSRSFTSPWPWRIEPGLPNLQGPRRLEYMRFNFESEE